MKIIERAEDLAPALGLIADSPWTGVDTEGDSLHHYTEKLCLVQVSVPGEDYIFDPLAGVDLAPLVQTLARKPLILHGADFDLRMLRRFYGVVPQEIMDTMIASQLLGYPKQGLADLALQFSGVSLSKSSQKADWSRRPLDQKLLDYAANDTHHLECIWQGLRVQLDQLGRLEWHRQCCRRLVDTIAAMESAPRPLERPWQIKGSRELDGRARAILKVLWLWREDQAGRRDRPSFKVLSPQTMVEIAKQAAMHPESEIAGYLQTQKAVWRDDREELVRRMTEAWLGPPEYFVPVKKHSSRRHGGVKFQERLERLKAERNRVAAELKIQPGVLAPNSALVLVAGSAPVGAASLSERGGLMPWQAEVLSASFSAIV